MARLSKQQLADTSRYQFNSEEVEIPELDGSVLVKTLSVKERNDLPDLVDEDGKPKAGVDELAGVFAAVVSEPKVTVKEAKGFLGDLPAPALDRVIETFGELLEGKEDEGKESDASSSDAS